MYNMIHVDEVRRLHAQGLNDYEIADISGIPRYTVRRIRIRENLEPVKRTRKPHGAAIYDICRPDTCEVVFTGNAAASAAFLGFDNIRSFFTAVCRSNKGTYRRYIIRNVTKKEQPEDE